MPQSNAQRKPSTSTQPAVVRVESRRQRLERGISALQVALECLPLTGQQRVLVQSLLHDQGKILALVESTRPTQAQTKKAPLKSTASKKESKTPKTKPCKTPLSPEEQARRMQEGQAKSRERIEREKRIRMIESQKRAEIEATHRKSGFTTFMLRAPGSFGGGKK